MSFGASLVAASATSHETKAAMTASAVRMEASQVIPEKIIRQVERLGSEVSQKDALLVVLARPEAEADPIAVAVMAAIDPLVGHAPALISRIVLIAAADLPGVRFPQPVNHQTGAGQDRGAVGQVHGAERLAGERARFGRPA